MVWLALAVFGALVPNVTAGPLDTWTLRHAFQSPVPSLSNLASPQIPFRGLAYGGNLFVAVGGNGTVLTTPDPDASPWILRATGTTAHLAAVTFDETGRTFVAVGSDGTILTSTNAVTWIRQASGTSVGLNAVTRGNDLFVAVGDSGVILTSRDGAIWTRQSPSFQGAPPPALLGVAYGNGIYVVVGLGTILTSSDGVRWVAPQFPGSSAPPLLRNVTYAKGLYVTIADDGRVFTSPDAANWAQHNIPVIPFQGPFQFPSLTYFNETFIAVGDALNISGTSGVIITSRDGATWVARVIPPTVWLNAITVDQGKVVAVGGGYTGTVRMPDAILSSSDGIAWRDAGTPPTLRGVVFGGDQFVAVGSDGTILTSPDGAAWQEQTVGLGLMLNSVACAGNLYVAVGNSGTIFNSADGRSWRSSSLGGSRVNLRSVASGNGLFTTVGGRDDSAASVILTSRDGVDWTTTGAIGASLYGVAHGQERFVAVGGNFPGPQQRFDTRATSVSTDGFSWTETVALGAPLSTLAFGNGLFVALDFDFGSNRILTSTDGDKWTYQSSRNTSLLSNLAFGAGTFVVVGPNGTILSSINGTNWVQRNTGHATNLNAVAFGKRTFVAVGDFGTILQSGEFPLPSAPALSNLIRADGVFNFSLPTLDGAVYTVEFKNSLTETNWQGLTRLEGDGTFRPVNDASASTRQRFYRLRVD